VARPQLRALKSEGELVQVELHRELATLDLDTVVVDLLEAGDVVRHAEHGPLLDEVVEVVPEPARPELDPGARDPVDVQEQVARDLRLDLGVALDQRSAADPLEDGGRRNEGIASRESEREHRCGLPSETQSWRRPRAEGLVVVVADARGEIETVGQGEEELCVNRLLLDHVGDLLSVGSNDAALVGDPVDLQVPVEKTAGEHVPPEEWRLDAQIGEQRLLVHLHVGLARRPRRIAGVLVPLGEAGSE
jgi:hypothetical protein